MLEPLSNGPYRIITKLSDINYDIVRYYYHTGKNSEIVHVDVSKFRPYSFP